MTLRVLALVCTMAAAVAAAGFDEIQFDYVRLPDAVGLSYSQPETEATRIAAIDGFLGDARKALAPSGAALAADIFGYVCWNTGDTRIGQQLERIAQAVDYISPMLYPSSNPAWLVRVRRGDPRLLLRPARVRDQGTSVEAHCVGPSASVCAAIEDTRRLARPVAQRHVLGRPSGTSRPRETARLRGI
jgi:hypothetical protein